MSFQDLDTPARAAPKPERFPAGLFNEGDRVRLREPDGHENVFDDPKGVLTVAGVHWFRNYALPTYALLQEGGIGVTPFRDGDLRAA